MQVTNLHKTYLLETTTDHVVEDELNDLMIQGT